MTIANYTDLQNAVMNWLDRSDLSSFVPDFITMSEAYYNRNLRARQMMTQVALTTTLGQTVLPTDFAGAASVWLTGTNSHLDPIDPEGFYEKYGDGAGGTPQAYSIAGSAILVGPVSDTTALTMLYYARIPALSVSNPTNWLLTDYPDLYLFGSLAEAELFNVDSPNAGIWKARRDDTVIDVNMSDNFRFRGNSPQVRAIGRRP